MSILSVRHITTYRYKKPVGFGEHRLMFRPRDSFDQRLLSSSLTIAPEPQRVSWMHDVFGNCVAVVEFEHKATELVFDASLLVEHAPQNAPDFSMELYARDYPFTYGAEEMPDLTRLIERRYLDPDHEIDAWVKKFLRPGRTIRTAELLMTITCAIRDSFTYQNRAHGRAQEPLVTLSTRRGACRDFAVLMMEAVRALGLAARFVSGYLHVRADESQPAVGGGNTHAWCEVFLPGAGWVEFDPTNGIVGNRGLIRVAVTRDAHQATPLWGSFDGTAADSLSMEVSVDVREAKPEDARRIAAV